VVKYLLHSSIVETDKEGSNSSDQILNDNVNISEETPLPHFLLFCMCEILIAIIHKYPNNAHCK